MLKFGRVIRNLLLLSGWALVLMTLEMGCAAYQKSGGADNRLFSDVPGYSGKIDEAMRSRIIRYRFVNVDFQVMGETKKNEPGHAKSGSSLLLNLFDDAVFRAILDRREVRSERSFSWLGTIEGIRDSQVTLVVEDGVMAGNIRLPQTYYQVRYAGQGTHVIYQVNPNAFPREGPPIVVPGGRQ